MRGHQFCHRYISPEAKRLLQRLTAPRATLSYNSETQTWLINRNDPATKSESRAAKEILRLCLLKTDLIQHPVKHFSLTREASRVLLNPEYQPAYLKAKIRS